MLLQSLSCTRKGYKNRQPQESINFTSSPGENNSIIIYIFVIPRLSGFPIKSGFRDSTWSHELLSMPRLLNQLMKNPYLTVNGSTNNH